jgi:hypothetical protein
MQDSSLGPLALEVFATVTGMGFPGAERSTPERFPNAQVEDFASQTIGPDSADGLWPRSPNRMESWWANQRTMFLPGKRYFRGEEITVPLLKTVMADGEQCFRADAALELGLRDQRAPLFEVRQPGFFQLSR